MRQKNCKKLKNFGTLFITLVFLSGCAGIRPPRNSERLTRTLLVTGYSHDKESTGWKRNIFLQPVYAYGPNKGKRKQVGVTASGTKARHGTIAADTRLYPFGTVMYVPDYGYGRVEDRGGAIKGHHIDLYFKRRGDALEWGRQKKEVKIWIPREKVDLRKKRKKWFFFF